MSSDRPAQEHNKNKQCAALTGARRNGSGWQPVPLVAVIKNAAPHKPERPLKGFAFNRLRMI